MDSASSEINKKIKYVLIILTNQLIISNLLTSGKNIIKFLNDKKPKGLGNNN